MEIRASAARHESPFNASWHVLQSKRDEILLNWVERVKSEVASASHLQNPIIIDTIPCFLDGLAEALDPGNPKQTAVESSILAQEHGGERARVTAYGPDQVLHELQILRDIVRTELKNSHTLTEQDESVIRRSFDDAIQEAMSSYFLAHAHLREQFVATLTHDLRNPISAVKMASELIASFVKEEAESATSHAVLDMAVRITRNAVRADRMIQQLLDASVIQVGEKPPVNIAVGDMQSVVREALGEFSDDYARRLRLEAVSVRGHWDLEALRRSVENLVHNAFKYGSDGTPVGVRIQSANGRVIVSVHNEGTPIPLENLESLFQVYCRAETAKRSGKKGWGLGLALARATAERMGGSLGADSSPENGTTFTIDIPCDARPYVDAPTILSAQNLS